MAARPERTKAGETSINVPKSAMDSVDYVLDGLGLPEVSPAAERVAPATVADALGVPTPDDITDEMLEELDAEFDVPYPPER